MRRGAPAARALVILRDGLTADSTGHTAHGPLGMDMLGRQQTRLISKSSAMTYIVNEACIKWIFSQPIAAWITVWRSAIVVLEEMTTRRQIGGLTPRKWIRS